MLKFVNKQGQQIMELKDNDELTIQESKIEKSFKLKEAEKETENETSENE